MLRLTAQALLQKNIENSRMDESPQMVCDEEPIDFEDLNEAKLQSDAEDADFRVDDDELDFDDALKSDR